MKQDSTEVHSPALQAASPNGSPLGGPSPSEGGCGSCDDQTTLGDENPVLSRIEYAWHSLQVKAKKPSLDMWSQERLRFPLRAWGAPGLWSTRVERGRCLHPVVNDSVC